MSSEYFDSENPNSSVVRTPSKSSSFSSSESSSIHLSADSPNPLIDRLWESAQALKTLAGNLIYTRMASSSHLAKGSSSEDDHGVETHIAHDQDHGIYTLGPICTERPLFSHITESFIIPGGF